MNSRDKISRRETLAACRALLTARQAEYIREIASLDQATAGETKSSAGDKYETAREMLAQSRNILARNLADTESGLKILERLEQALVGDADGSGNPSANSCAGFGSLLETDHGLYLLGLGLGEVVLPAGQTVTAISFQSPLGAAFKGKRTGETVATKRGALQIVHLID